MARSIWDSLRAHFRAHPRLKVVCLSLLLGLPLVLVLAGPWILVETSLRQQLVSWIAPQFQGTCTIGKASLGWFSTVELRDVDVMSREDAPLLSDAEITLDRTLLELLFEGIDGATLTIANPHIDLVADDRGTNWERALAPLLSKSDAGGSVPAITIQLQQGTVDIYGADRQTGRLSQWNLVAQIRPGEVLPLAVETSATIASTHAADTPGQISAVLRFAPAGAADSPTGELTWETTGVQMDSIAPILHQLLPKAQLRGRLTSIATLDWQRDTARAEIKLMGHECAFQSPEVLSGETLVMQQGNLEVRATKQGTTVKVDRLRFGSDLAEFDLTALCHHESQSSGEEIERLPLRFEAVQARGSVDLARIAAQLPVALRLRQGTQIRSGQLEFSVDLAAAENGRRWQADVTASELAAIADGRPLRWKRPIAMQLKLQETGNGHWRGNAVCRSDHLAIQATGSPRAATLAFQADLTELARDIQPLVDLDGMQLAGRMQASVDLTRKDSGRVDVDGQGIIEAFDLRLAEGKEFSEPRMTLRLQGQASMKGNKLVALREALLRVNSAQDHAEVKLASPVTLAHLLTGLPLEIRAGGDLASWHDRASLQQVFSAGPPEGTFNTELQGRFSLAEIQLDRGEMKIKNLKLPLESGVLKQPDLTLTGRGGWKPLSGEFTDLAIGIRAPAFAAWTEKMNIQIPDGGDVSAQQQRLPVADGTLFLRGDLAALAPLLLNRSGAADFSVTGRAEGKFEFETEAQKISLTPHLAIRQFSVQKFQQSNGRVVDRGATAAVQPTSLTPVWQDQEISLNGRLVYDTRQDQIRIEQLAAGSRALGVSQCTGTITGLAGQPLADLEGELSYDLATVTRMLEGRGFDDQLAIVGKGKRPFFYRGPLAFDQPQASGADGAWWAGIEAGAGLSWDFFQVLGLRGSRGDFRAELTKGIIRGSPIDISFGGGQLRTVPFVRFDSGPPVLLLSQDTQISRALITEELCRDWLQYLAPVMADATRAEGQFSLQLNRSVIPVETPRAGTLEGTFTIHEANIRPGPVTREIANIAAQVDALINRRPTPNEPALKIDPQEIPFRMVRGRVEHQNFKIEVGDVMVRTSGSVGLDQTLDLVAEIPIREKWVQRDPVLRSLAGQTLKVPIRGTVQKPKLDGKAIAQLSKQMLQGAAGGVLNNAIERGLQKGLEELFR